MQLQTTVTPAMVQLAGQQDEIIVNAGQSLIMETSPGGLEILSAEVPVGKQWTVAIGVDVRERDI